MRFTRLLTRSHLLLLNHYKRIGQAVAHVNGFSFLVDIGMLGHHEPANVREKQSTSGIVRIGIAVLVFVMHAMIVHPHPDAVLMGNRVEKRQQQFQRPLGFVRLVRPQSVCAGCNSQ